MLALVTMDDIRSFDSDEVRSKRAAILKYLPKMTRKEVEKSTYRAQYDRYKDVEGVSKDSRTETYFKI